MTTRKRHPDRPVRRAVTLIETVVVVTIIAVLAGVLLTALGYSLRGGRVAAETQLLRSVMFAATKFEQDFGFPVPLVSDDNNPLDTERQPLVARKTMLSDPATGPRWSIRSVPYFLIGVLDADSDGVKGPGFTAWDLAKPSTSPTSEGGYSRRGGRYEAMLDMSRNSDRLVYEGGDVTRAHIEDRWKNPIRYYRWEPQFETSGADAGQMKDPAEFLPADLAAIYAGTSERSISLRAPIRAARYAVMSTGPNGILDEPDSSENDDLWEFSK